MNLTVNIRGLDELIDQLDNYANSLEQRANEICRRLAQYGLVLADASFNGAAYDGTKDVSVTVEPTDNGYRIIADGETVLILEFGAGVTYGYGHPNPGRFGPGTYPNAKGHWNDPNGWWIPKDKGGGHTYGNPPSMTMYNTYRDIQREVERVAREVFNS